MSRRAPFRSALVGARLTALLCIAAGTVGAGAACGDDAPRDAPDNALRLAVASAPESLDPRRATSAVAQRLAALVAAPLFVVGDDLAPTPLLAARLVEESPTSYVVELRDGARFADGTPVTADDVAWTFSSIFRPETRSPHAARFASLDRVEVVDSRRARFVLKEPFAPFPVEIAAIGILSQAACPQGGAPCSVGAGPFRVAAAASGLERVDLVPNPAYVDGAPAIPRIVVRVVRDANTRVLELLRGKTDLVVGDVSPTDLRALSRAQHLVVQRRPGLGYTYLAFNVRRGPLADARVRRAIAHAIDVDAIVRAKLAGAAARATGLLPDGHWAKDPAAAPIPFDPDRARALLREAGPDPIRVRLSTTTDRLRRGIAIVVAAQLRDVGVQVDLDVREWASLYEDVQKGQFDLFSAKWTPVVEPDLLRWVFHSASVPAPGKAGGNRGGYVDAELDGLLDAARATTDRAARAELYRRAEAVVARDLPYVPLWFEDEIAVHAPRLQGFALSRTGSLLPLAKARLR